VSVFIDQPFTTRAMLLTSHAIKARGSLGTLSSAVLVAGSSLSISKLLPRSIPIRPHLGEDRLIGDVRRLDLQDLCGVSEELTGRHRVDLDLRRSARTRRGCHRSTMAGPAISPKATRRRGCWTLPVGAPPRGD
jgi:hypothetical protein